MWRFINLRRRGAGGFWDPPHKELERGGGNEGNMRGCKIRRKNVVRSAKYYSICAKVWLYADISVGRYYLNVSQPSYRLYSPNMIGCGVERIILRVSSRKVLGDSHQGRVESC